VRAAAQHWLGGARSPLLIRRRPKGVRVSFQAYIDNIYKQTGKTPDDFKAAAEQKGLLRPGTKATQITDWLREEYGLGLGHARAIYATLKPHVGQTA